MAGSVHAPNSRRLHLITLPPSTCVCLWRDRFAVVVRERLQKIRYPRRIYPTLVSLIWGYRDTYPVMSQFVSCGNEPHPNTSSHRLKHPSEVARSATGTGPHRNQPMVDIQHGHRHSKFGGAVRSTPACSLLGSDWRRNIRHSREGGGMRSYLYHRWSA